MRRLFMLFFVFIYFSGFGQDSLILTLHRELAQRWQQEQRKIFLNKFKAKANPAVSVNVTDSLALVSFYSTTNGNSWGYNDGWLTDSVYKWYGVTIDSNGRVIGLDLHSNNLSGYISYDIGNLTELRFLDLSNNDLSGEIPSTIANLKKLAYFSVLQNNISGEFPLSICAIDSLQTLNLSRNNISGCIPDSIRHLQKLISLSAYGNNLDCDFPLVLTQLPSLQLLDLSFNQLHGQLPSEISNLTNLQELLLIFNDLEGEIPQSLYSMTNLTALGLFANHFTGGISPDFQNLVNLEYLFLGYNPLGGTIPPELFNLTALKALILDSCLLTGTIPDNIDNMADLEFLYLSRNQLESPIPASIGNLTNLYGLYLSHNQFTGQIPAVLGNLINLTYLDLSNNQFTSPIPATFQNLDQVIELKLDSNQFTGSIPAELYDMQSLRRLYLNNNQFSGTISDSIRYLTELRLLNISHNQFSGELPDGLSDLVYLDEIDFSYNQITGLPSSINNSRLTKIFGRHNLISHLPPSIGEMPSLAYLDLAQNLLEDTLENLGLFDESLYRLLYVDFSYNPRLKGSLANALTVYTFNLRSLNLAATQVDVKNLPDKFFTNGPEYINFNYLRVDSLDPRWGNMTSLKYLLMRSCNIHGDIPENMFDNLDQLEYLDLSSNFLDSAPDSLFALRNLKYLNLVGNNISRELPDYISQMTQLTYLNLNLNNFYGQLPDLSSLTNLDTLILDENPLTGNLPDLRQMPNMIYFSAYNTDLSGTLPELPENSKLKYIKLGKGSSQANITGTIPASYGNAKLDFLYLYNTKIEGMLPATFADDTMALLFVVSSYLDSIPPLPNAQFGYVYLVDNKLDFADLQNVKQAMLDTTQLFYWPQKNLGDTLYYKFVSGEDYTFYTHVDGDNNQYQWFKDDTVEITGATLPYLQITAATEQDTGKYTCEVTNPDFPELTIHINPIYLTNLAHRATFVVKDPSDNPIQGALITVNDFYTLTDENGIAYYDALSGSFTAVITKNGFEDTTISFDLDNDTVINVTLRPAIVTGVPAREQIAVYPNPTTGIIRFDLPQGQTAELTIVDLKGRVLRKFHLDGRNVIDLSWLEPGVYLVQIRSAEGVIMRRIIKH